MKLNLLLGAAVFSIATSTLAQSNDYVQLPDGTRGKVVRLEGTNRGYLKSAKKTAGGKLTLIPGEFFVGTRIVRTDLGTCFSIRDELIKIERVSSGDLFVEAPMLKTETSPVGCEVLASSSR